MNLEERRQFCTFALGAELYGIEVKFVQEVLRAQKLTHVPRSPALVRGLMNVRGKIVLVIDLGLRLGLSRSEPPPQSMNIVLRHDGGSTALLVDRICEVVEVLDRDFEGPPATLGPSMKSLIRGSYKLDSGLLLVLAPEQLGIDHGHAQVT